MDTSFSSSRDSMDSSRGNAALRKDAVGAWLINVIRPGRSVSFKASPKDRLPLRLNGGLTLPERFTTLGVKQRSGDLRDSAYCRHNSPAHIYTGHSLARVATLGFIRWFAHVASDLFRGCGTRSDFHHSWPNRSRVCPRRTPSAWLSVPLVNH